MTLKRTLSVFMTLIIASATLIAKEKALTSLALEKGFGSWTARNALIKSSPLGKKYCELNSQKTNNARIISPMINVTGMVGQKIIVSFKYRTQVVASRVNKGVWVYAGFYSLKDKAITPYNGLTLQRTSQWKDETWELKIPKNAAKLNVQFRIQSKVGALDLKAITIEAKDTKPDEKNSERLDGNLEALAEFRLKETDGKMSLKSGDIDLPNKLSSKRPCSFILPAKYCDDKKFIYDIEAEFSPGWDTTKENAKSYALFTLGRNMTGHIQPNSATLIFWKGETLYARLTASTTKEKAQAFYKKFIFSKGKTYKASLRFGGKGIKLFWEGKLLSKEYLTEGFAWPAEKRFYIGGEDSDASLFKGQIKAFTLKVSKQAISCEPEGGLDAGYFFGSGPHIQKLIFKNNIATKCDSLISIEDIDGNTIASKINPFEKTENAQSFKLPLLPFGWYKLKYKTSDGKYVLKNNRPFVVLPNNLSKDTAKDSPFGNATDVGYFHDNPKTFERIDREFKMLSQMGMRWIRLTLPWDMIEKERGKYNWKAMDKIVELAEKHGLQINLMLVGGKQPFQSWIFKEKPKWFVRPGFALPFDLETWKKYVKAMAERYKGRITCYQIWGEPDTRCALYPFKTEKYTELLKESNNILKSVDKNIQVGIGGFCVALEGRHLNKATHKDSDSAWGGAEFYNLNPQKDFDIVAVHLYSLENPQQIWDKNMDDVLRMKKFLASKGESQKPIWNTETSFFTGTPGTKGGWTGNTDMISEKTQAARLVQLYVESAAVGIEKTFWYGLKGRIGVINSDFSPRPNYAACSVLADKLTGMKYSSAMPFDGAMHGYRFKGKKGNLAVLWTNFGKMPLIATPKNNTKISFCDIMGNTSELDTSSGFAVIEAGEMPSYIQSLGDFEISPAIQVKVPKTLIEGNPFEIEIVLRNPSSEKTEFKIGAALGNSTPTVIAVSLNGKESKTEKIAIATGKGILNVEVSAKGGLNNHFANKTKCKFKKSLILADNETATVLINKENQVGLGRKVLDMQNRVMVASNWKGPKDLNAQITFTRKGKEIFFDAQIKDNKFQPAPKSSNAIYNGDAFELFFDFRKKGNNNPEQIYQAIIGADGRLWFQGDKMPEGFEAKAEKIDDGYKITGKFTVPEYAKHSFGFDIAIDDADKSEKNARNTQMVWSETPHGHEPDDFGIIILK